MEQISRKQASCIMILFILGSNLVTGVNMSAKQDSWISVILAALISTPIVLIFAQFKKMSNDKDLFDFAYYAFGKKIGFLLTLAFTIYTIRLASMIIRNFSEFIQVVSLHETPQFLNALCIGFLGLYTLKKGLEVLARGTTFVLPVIVLTTIMLVFLSLRHMNLEYIQPVLENDFGSIFKGALYTAVFPFLETVMFIMVFANVKSDVSPTRLYLVPYYIGAFWLVVIVIRNMLVLGVPTMESMYFSTYYAVGVIDIKDFISRIEIVVSGSLIISGLLKLTVCLFVSSKGVAKLINIKDYKKVASPITLFCIAFSGVVFKNTMNMFENIGHRRLLVLIFQALFPIVILIGAKIKNKKISKKTA